MKYLYIKTLTGYVDRDHLLLHACFQILTDFLEKENVNMIDWDADKEHLHAKREMDSLYKWWKEERPNRVDPWNEYYEKNLSQSQKDKWFSSALHGKNDQKWINRAMEMANESGKLEDQWLKEDTANLIRLMKIRSFMWT